MFSQKEIAAGFGITPQAVTLALRGVPFERRVVEQTEGSRVVRRSVKAYSNQAVFRLAVRTGKLPEYRELCIRYSVSPEIFHVAREEVNFAELLRKFLPSEIEIIAQHRVDQYRIDFYLPAYELAIEYDEHRHKVANRRAEDRNRQEFIERHYGIRFIRVAQGHEEAGLFSIAQAMLASSRE